MIDDHLTICLAQACQHFPGTMLWSMKKTTMDHNTEIWSQYSFREVKTVDFNDPMDFL